MKTLFSHLLLLVLPLVAFTQIKDLKVRSFKVENGMPENRITGLLQDKLGYIWAGTQNGLVRYDGYNLKVYKLFNKKGKLTFCSIRSLYMAPDSAIWINVLYEGLYKYNPSTDDFIRFGLRQLGTDTLNTDISNFIDDGKGNLFIHYFNLKNNLGYINIFNKATGNFTIYGSTEKGDRFLPVNRSCSFLKGTDGRLWTIGDSTLYYYDYQVKKFINFFTLPQTSAGSLLNDVYQQSKDNDHLWVTSFDSNYSPNAVVKISIKNKTYTIEGGKNAMYSLKGNVYKIVESKDKKLWFCADSGLSFFDQNTGLYSNYSIGTKKRVFDIKEDSKGNFWCITSADYDGNLAFFNTTTSSSTLYLPNDLVPGSLPSGLFSLLLGDKNGSLWIGTSSHGLLALNNNRSMFRFQTKQTDDKDGFPSGKIRSFTSKDGNLYWITTANGIFTWNRSTNKFTAIDLLNKGKDIHFYYPYIDNEGDVWLCSNNKGLYRYDPKSSSIKNYRYNKNNNETIASDNINILYEDREGMLWIGTGDKGLCSLNKKTEKITRYPFIENTGHTPNGASLDDGTVLAIFEDKEGTIWVGTNIGGINHLNRQTNTFKSFHDMDNGFETVDAIHEDKKGRLWAGTYLWGLFLVDKNKGPIKRFTEKDGLLYDGINDMQEDREGNIWISTLRGLSKFNPDSSTFQNFTTASGLPDNELTGTIDTASNGDIVINTRSGIISFNPYSFTPNPYPPQVHIESVAYNDPRETAEKWKTVFIDQNKSIELPYNQNRITYNFVALHFVNPSQNKYSYMLEGYDKQWSQPGTERSVTYTNLSPGKYIFHVIASNSDGVWNKTGDSFTIVIRYPWWQRWWAWMIYFVLFSSAIYLFVAFRSRKLKRENTILEQKVTHRTEQLQHSIEELKTTQQQLIQSEKLASLGELTAGIAHEIQNPLNFVNNFSEVSLELTSEMKEEFKNGNTEEAIAIANDIEQNLEKIVHHGKRADAIVKNMLLHSRNNSGERQMTDINALADEYFRLSYHGLRAKDKSFNSGMMTELDATIPKLNIIPQDICRVFLNLFNNAFYAVQQKQKKEGGDYKPEVKLSTALIGKFVAIMVWDNGTGIAEAVKSKILQPFFTTKPTGEGTGLGLSLSYDIVVKGHGGKIEVESKEGQYTQFVILLPA